MATGGLEKGLVLAALLCGCSGAAEPATASTGLGTTGPNTTSGTSGSTGTGAGTTLGATSATIAATSIGTSGASPTSGGTATSGTSGSGGSTSGGCSSDDGCAADTFCQAGSCALAFCSPDAGANALCTSGENANDGTCVGANGVVSCIRGGTLSADGGAQCNPTLDFFGADNGQRCPAGTLCGADGQCDVVCDPLDGGGVCSAGSSCLSDNLIAPLALNFAPFSANAGLCQRAVVAPDGGAFTVAPHTPFTPIGRGDGPTIPAPEIVTVSFAGTEARYHVKEFGDWIVQSTWFSQVGPSYGITSGSHPADVQLPYGFDAGALITDAEIRTLLYGIASDGGISYPGTVDQLLSDPNVVYLIFFPAGVTVRNGSARSCGNSFYGYHGAFVSPDANKDSLVYAIDVDCSEADWTASDRQQWVDRIASHEVLEAATDPFGVFGTFGFAFEGLTTVPWGFDTGEVADVCAGSAVDFYPLSDGGFFAQEIWSNPAAEDGGSPCTPSPSPQTYFSVSPVVDGGTNALAVLKPRSTPQTVVFSFTGWATGPTTDWYVYAYPSPTSGFFPQDYGVSTVSQPPTASYIVPMNNGRRADFTVVIPANAGLPDGGSYAGTNGTTAVFELTSTQDPTSAVFNEWPVAVWLVP